MSERENSGNVRVLRYEGGEAAGSESLAEYVVALVVLVGILAAVGKSLAVLVSVVS